MCNYNFLQRLINVVIEIRNNNAEQHNDIKMDADGHADRQKVLGEQLANAKLYSIAETFQFLAAALLPVGLGTVIASAKFASGVEAGAGTVATVGAAGAAVAGEITLASIAAAFAAPAAMVILGAAAVCTAVAITSRFMASKHHHKANFNSTEINAQHTAKYIAKELKAEAACITPENTQNMRADGKQWAQVVQPKEVSNVLSFARS